MIRGKNVDYSLIKASQRLSELNIRIVQEGYTIDVYWFRVMFKQGDWYIKDHAHSTSEFHFVARGDCILEISDRRYKVTQGMFFLTAPGVHHVQSPGDCDQLVEYSLNCDIHRTGIALKPGPPPQPDGPADSSGGEMAWLESVFLHAPCAPVADTYGAFPLFEAALLEADRGLPGFETTIRNLVVMILVATARAMKAPAGPDEPGAVSHTREDRRMATLERFVTDNLSLEIGPADLAAFLNLSERQTGRIISHHKGYSTKKFITRTRLKKAKQLLCDTDMTLKEIAEMLGFSSEYYFSSVFKKHEGYPPGLFRKSMRGKADPGAVS